MPHLDDASDWETCEYERAEPGRFAEITRTKLVEILTELKSGKVISDIQIEAWRIAVPAMVKWLPDAAEQAEHLEAIFDCID